MNAPIPGTSTGRGPAVTASAPDRAGTPAATPTACGVTLARAARAEWVKLATLRSTWFALTATVLGTVAVALLATAARALTAGAAAPGGAAGPAGTILLTGGITVAQIPVVVLGVLAITSEHTTGTVRVSLAAVPRRWTLLVAKGVVVAGASFAAGVVGVLLAFVATWPLLGQQAPNLLSAQGAHAVAGAGAYLAGIAVLSLAVGALLRSAAGGTAVVLVVLLVLPLGLAIGATTGLPELAEVAPYLPGTAGGLIMEADVAGGPLGPWSGLGVMVLWVLVVGGAAGWLLQRRDA